MVGLVTIICRAVYPDLNFRGEGVEEGLPSAIIVLANSEWVSGENSKNLARKSLKRAT